MKRISAVFVAFGLLTDPAAAQDFLSNSLGAWARNPSSKKPPNDATRD